MADHPPARRATVYLLNDDGKWDQRATGTVRYESDHASNSYLLKVTAEETGHVALSTTLRASHGANYQMKDDKFISWNEPSLASPPGKPTEVALSFADESDCRELWGKICLIESTKDPAAPAPPDRPHVSPPPPPNALITAASSSLDNALDESVLAACISPPPDAMHGPQGPNATLSVVDPPSAEPAHSRFLEDHLDGSSVWSTPDSIDDVLFQETPNVLFLPTSSAPPLAPSISTADVVVATAATASSTPPFTMPAPDRAGVETLSKFIANHNASHLPTARTRINAELSSSDYVERLCQLFRAAEDGADYDYLVDLHIIMRFFFAVADNKAIQVLLHERYVMDIVGCLEYAPDRIAAFLRPAVMAESSAENNSQPIQAAKKDDSKMSDAPDNTVENSTRPTGEDGKTPSSQMDDAVKGAATKTNSQNGDAANDPRPMDVDTSQSSELQNTGLPESVHVSTEGSNTDSAPFGPKPHLRKSSSEDTTTSSDNITGDAEKSTSCFRTHRDFLQCKAHYKVVVPINEQAILAKIHQNFRAAYIRDVILRAVGDSPLSSTILSNNVEIIMYIVSGTVLQDLFESLQVAIQNLHSQQRHPASMTTMQNAPAAGTWELSKPESESNSTLKKSQPGQAEPENSIKSSTTPTHPETSDNSTAKTGVATGVATGTAKVKVQVDTEAQAKGKESTSPKDASSQDPESDGKAAPDSGTADPKSSEPCETQPKDLWNMLKFLKELCRIVKGQNPGLKNGFHKTLLNLGIVEVTLLLLHDGDVSLRSLCSEILWCVIMHDQAEIRTHILKCSAQDNSAVAPTRVEAKGSPVCKAKTEDRDGAGNVGSDCCDARKNDVAEDVEMSDEPNFSESADDGKDAPESEANGKAGSDSPELRKLAEVALHSNQKADNKDDQGGQSVSNVTNVNSLSLIVGHSAAMTGSPGEDGAVAVPNRDIPALRKETIFPLLSYMVKIICKEDESGVAMTMLDLLRSLLDPTNMRTQVENSLFLNVFYEKFIAQLLPPVMNFSLDGDGSGGSGNGDGDGSGGASAPSWVATNAGHIVDLLSFCLKFHAFMCKVFVIQKDVGTKVMKLAKHRKPHVQLAAARFLRACLGVKDDMMDRYILRMKLFEPIMELFKKNCKRDNMVTSVVLDLVSFLCRANRMVLSEHVVSTYREVLETSAISKGIFSDLVQKVNAATAEPSVLAVTGLVVNGERKVPQGMGMNMIGNVGQAHGGGVRESNIQVLLNSPRIVTVKDVNGEPGKAGRAAKRGVSGSAVVSQVVECNSKSENENLVTLMVKLMNEKGTLQLQRLFEKRRRPSRQGSKDIRKIANRQLSRVTGLRSKAIDSVLSSGKAAVGKVDSVEENKAASENKGDGATSRRMKLSLSKSEAVRNKGCGAKMGEEWDEGQWMSDSSEGEQEESVVRKRGRGYQSKVVQTSTIAVVERRKGSDSAGAGEDGPRAKRARVVEERSWTGPDKGDDATQGPEGPSGGNAVD